jgi:hypothetical protein
MISCLREDGIIYKIIKQMGIASLILSQDGYRNYTSVGRYLRSVESIIEQYQNIYPTQDFSRCIKVESVSEAANGQRKHALKVKHAVVPGVAEIAQLEQFLGCEIPECLKNFYKEIKECLLILRYPIRIYSPATLALVEKTIREAERTAGCTVPSEVSILRFIEIPGFSSCFALRKFSSGEQWRIVHCGDETTEELQNNANLWRKEDCENFDTWFHRILETDGAPLVLDNPYIFRSPMADRVNEM